MVVESRGPQLQNAGKHISATIEFQNFPGEHAPDPPSGQGPPGLPILYPGVKLSCLLDENLNEPPENYKEGRGKKPKIQECLNSQEIRKVNKVKKQNKTNKNK